MRLLLLLLSCFAGAVQAAEFRARVIAVLDGDTVLIRQANTLTKIRLAGIDAPEKDQSYGMQSKQSLSDMVLGKQVNVRSQAVDDYGRLVANLGLEGLDINAEQIRRGMAWEYSLHHSNKPYVALQQEAQQARRGLWAQADPMQPGLWRKGHAAPATPRPVTASNACGNKQRCSQMDSCEEAKYYFTHCRAQLLDGDNDGKPCETLCANKP